MSEAKGTRISTVANLCNNMLGASLLSLPWCLSKTGIILGLALHIISALLNGFAMMIIAISCDKTKSFTFRDLGKKTIGPTFGIILEVFILLYTTLTCVSMLVLTGDFISGSNGAALSLCEDDNGTICQLLRNRMLLVFVTTLLIVGPLSCLQSLHSLRYISIFSFLGVIYLAAFIPYDFSQAEIGPNIKYAIWGLGIFQAIPVFNETFVAQYNVPRYYYEMRNRSVKAFGRAVMTAMSICIIFYVLVAVFGYLAFGSDVNPDILSNYNRDYKAANVAKILMAFVVLSTYPLAFNSLRVSAAELFKTYSSFKLDDASHYYGLTLILVLMTMIPGAFITDISTVTDYKGSILGAFVAFIFGALIYLHTFFPELFNTAFMRHFRSAHEELAEEQRARLLIEHEVYSDNEYRRNNWKGFAYILILWAMMTFIMGTITTTQNAIKKSK